MIRPEEAMMHHAKVIVMIENAAAEIRGLRALNAELLAALREIHGASRETYVRQTAMDAIEKAQQQGTIEP